MIYRGESLLFFPILTLFVLSALKHYDVISWAITFDLAAAIYGIYALFTAIILGLFFTPHPKVEERGPFRYYFAKFQGQYHINFQSMLKLFTKDELEILDKQAQFLGIYWDNPEQLENKNTCRCLMGFVIEQIQDNIAFEVLEKALLNKVNLDSWKSIEAHMRLIFDYSDRIAPRKLISPIYEFARTKNPGQYLALPVYELCKGELTTYGVFRCESKEMIQKLEPYPQPKLITGQLKEILD